jgi:hypothetical protein
LFSAGEPATNTKGTVVTAAWLNGVQEEIVNVILAAGLVPDGADLAQLTQAIKRYKDTVTTTKYDLRVESGVLVLKEV